MFEKLSVVILIVSVVVGCVYGIFNGFVVAGVYGIILTAIDPPDQGH